MNKRVDHKLVNQCLLIIERKLGWGSAEHWHNEVFQELSQKIENETNVRLSPTTLKRVWGRVEYKNAPSISTLNALSIFAGYENWRDFKNKSTVQEKDKKEKISFSNQGIIITSAAFLTVVFISFFS